MLSGLLRANLQLRADCKSVGIDLDNISIEVTRKRKPDGGNREGSRNVKKNNSKPKSGVDEQDSAEEPDARPEGPRLRKRSAAVALCNVPVAKPKAGPTAKKIKRDVQKERKRKVDEVIERSAVAAAIQPYFGMALSVRCKDGIHYHAKLEASATKTLLSKCKTGNMYRRKPFRVRFDVDDSMPPHAYDARDIRYENCSRSHESSVAPRVGVGGNNWPVL